MTARTRRHQDHRRRFHPDDERRAPGFSTAFGKQNVTLAGYADIDGLALVDAGKVTGGLTLDATGMGETGLRSSPAPAPDTVLAGATAASATSSSNRRR